MPTFGVIVAVVQDRKILLQQRQDFPIWGLPGGAVDSGESVTAAAVREVQEETGLDVRLTRLVGVYSHPQWFGGGNHQLLFAAVPAGGQLSHASAEMRDAGFFEPDHLPQPFLAI